MSGIDADVLQVQVDVLDDALAIHRAALQEAEQIELAALVAEKRAQDAAGLARQEQQIQRRAIADVTADADEIRAVLATIPTQRRPA